MLCGFFRLIKLPVASTFWRYVDSLGINQANSFLKIMSTLRERVWQLCDINYYKIRISIDTTVETIFGNQRGGRKGHNTKYRIALLKLLFIAAKVVKESNVDKVKYSIPDARTPAMMNFLKFLDKLRLKIRPWEENSHWPQRFSLQSW